MKIEIGQEGAGTRHVQASCDGCGLVIAGAAEVIAQIGWSFKDGKRYCPACSVGDDTSGTKLESSGGSANREG